MSTLLFRRLGCAEALFSYADKHNWLGLLWDPHLCFFSALEKRIAGVWGSVASLAGMIANRMIPLALGIESFESKVEGSLRLG